MRIEDKDRQRRAGLCRSFRVRRSRNILHCRNGGTFFPLSISLRCRPCEVHYLLFANLASPLGPPLSLGESGKKEGRKKGAIYQTADRLLLVRTDRHSVGKGEGGEDCAFTHAGSHIELFNETYFILAAKMKATQIMRRSTLSS